jgi:succinate dehydrogenase / fumarate reductase membrane anchor subunit
MRFQSPLARAQGMGSVKAGTHHWWIQRISAIALLPLTFYLLAFIHLLTTATYQETVAWLQQTFNAVGLLLWVIAVCYHAALGLQVVYEDYISTVWLRIAIVWLTHLIFTALVAVAVIALFHILSLG